MNLHWIKCHVDASAGSKHSASSLISTSNFIKIGEWEVSANHWFVKLINKNVFNSLIFNRFEPFTLVWPSRYLVCLCTLRRIINDSRLFSFPHLLEKLLMKNWKFGSIQNFKINIWTSYHAPTIKILLPLERASSNWPCISLVWNLVVPLHPATSVNCWQHWPSSVQHRSEWRVLIH